MIVPSEGVVIDMASFPFPQQGSVRHGGPGSELCERSTPAPPPLPQHLHDHDPSQGHESRERELSRSSHRFGRRGFNHFHHYLHHHHRHGEPHGFGDPFHHRPLHGRSPHRGRWGGSRGMHHRPGGHHGLGRRPHPRLNFGHHCGPHFGPHFVLHPGLYGEDGRHSGPGHLDFRRGHGRHRGPHWCRSRSLSPSDIRRSRSPPGFEGVGGRPGRGPPHRRGPGGFFPGDCSCPNCEVQRGESPSQGSPSSPPEAQQDIERFRELSLNA